MSPGAEDYGVQEGPSARGSTGEPRAIAVAASAPEDTRGAATSRPDDAAVCCRGTERERRCAATADRQWKDPCRPADRRMALSKKCRAGGLSLPDASARQPSRRPGGRPIWPERSRVHWSKGVLRSNRKGRVSDRQANCCYDL